MTNQEQKQYRTKLIRDASMMQKKPDRVPHVSFFVTWKILDAGYKLSEAMNDYAIMEKVVRRHQEEYGFDAIFEYGGRNAIRIPAALGGTTYSINDEAGTVNYKDKAICEHDELEELAADPQNFFYEKGMARKYPCWADGTVTAEDVQRAIDEQSKFIQYHINITRIMNEEYGMPNFTAPNGFAYAGLDFLFNTIRGIKGLSIDMRRDPAKVEEAIAALNELYFTPGLNVLKNAPEGPNMDYCFDYDITLLCHTILNQKQFERFLWPDLKAVLDVLAEKKKTLRLFMEGSSKRFWEYLKDYPKGMITMHPEQDDVFDVRKELPNCAILGGMPVSLLGNGTRQQCLDRTKLLCDELGKDGGFILCQDKMVSFRNDANPENVHAVCEFVREYRP
ncbi:hypothetical protein MUB23_14590 [Cuneatibacter sp. NSJ-177]|uniref:uroporphyrinogen decarboxylase family protein n=1 Tax=Cuneatibacter sp. NSJ-177 TaxID=2931401 RepID=UPI001FD2DBD8|nr:uroporphyrinogen decarboxylase family protein [Cuneatibacter sp. NSJ-177]MCJ7836614.1 hypothetical protein [Cuneatibacter sp. NSJ-177]